EAVDEGAVRVRRAALRRVATHPEVAVPDREQRLGQAEVRVAGEGLDEPPLVDGEALPVERVGAVEVEPHGTSSARSWTTTSAPASVSPSTPAPRSTPMTSPNSPAR